MRVASNSLPSRLKSAAPAGLGRWLAMALIIVAFLLQGYVAQTHMHTGRAAVSGITFSVSKTAHQLPAVPGKSDQTENCPLCQAVAHASAYFPPMMLDFLAHHRPGNVLPAVSARDMRAAYRGYREQQRGPPSL
jgi:hypothetical protein